MEEFGRVLGLVVRPACPGIVGVRGLDLQKPRDTVHTRKGVNVYAHRPAFGRGERMQPVESMRARVIEARNGEHPETGCKGCDAGCDEAEG